MWQTDCVQSFKQWQILLISIYVYKPHLSRESISSIPTSPPPRETLTSCQRTSRTQLQSCTRLEWAMRPTARSFMRRWELLVWLFGTRRNIMTINHPLSGARSCLMGWATQDEHVNDLKAFWTKNIIGNTLRCNVKDSEKAWKKVLGSGETKIELFGISSSRRVGMRRNAEDAPNHPIIPTVKNGGAKGTRWLHCIEEPMDRAMYSHFEWEFSSLSQNTEDELWMGLLAW